MTEEKQRIAIAEACGLKGKHIPNWIGTGNHDDFPRCYCQCGFVSETTLESKKHEQEFSPLDYLLDLNAMHEAEKVLSKEQIEAYLGWLWQICKVPFEANDYGLYFPLAHAIASQRAEAFLRTLGLWEENET